MSDRTKKIIEIILIALLSLAAGFGVSVHFCGEVWGRYTENYIEPLSALNFIVFAAVFVFLYFLLKILNKYREKISGWILLTKKNRQAKGKFFLIIFGGLLVLWLPYLLSFAPASVLNDSLSSVQQAFYESYNNGMPILYTFLIKFFVWVGNLCGNINIGIFAYACFQYLALACACASLVMWLYTHNVKIVIVIITAIFYAVFPIFPAYAITMWKDPVFSIGLVALSFILLNEKSTWYQILISGLVILFFRSNGLVIMIIIAAVMLISKQKRIQGLICTLAIVFFIISSNALLNYLNAERRNEETLGIPLQQIAYTVVYDYDNLSNDEMDSINKIMPIETIRDAYVPCLVDSIKWHEQFNTDYVRENTGEVLKLWLSLLPKHLESYIKAYALDTYGFWMPFVQADYGYSNLCISENEFEIHGWDLFERIFGISIKDKLADFKLFIGSGTLIWVTLLGCALCIISGQTKKLWFYLPGVFCWLSVMISTPVAFSLRYVFVLMMLVPIYFLIPFIDIQDKITEKAGR